MGTLSRNDNRKHIVRAAHKETVDLKSPGDNTRTQIDYMLINSRFRNALDPGGKNFHRGRLWQ